MAKQKETHETHEAPAIETHEAAAIACPLGPEPTPAVYHPRHVEIAGLTVGQSRALYRLREGLKSRGDLLRNSKPVYQNVDAVRWLLEQIDQAAPPI